MGVPNKPTMKVTTATFLASSAALLIVACYAAPLGAPNSDCTVPIALQCGKSVMRCISTCKQGVKACIECLGPDFKTCCPCLAKLDPKSPPSLCGNSSLPMMSNSTWAIKGPLDTCTGPHESCCPAPGDAPNNCPASARTSDCDKKKSCCCG